MKHIQLNLFSTNKKTLSGKKIKNCHNRIIYVQLIFVLHFHYQHDHHDYFHSLRYHPQKNFHRPRKKHLHPSNFNSLFTIKTTFAASKSAFPPSPKLPENSVDAMFLILNNVHQTGKIHQLLAAQSRFANLNHFSNQLVNFHR